jgi:UDP-GlcNAc:undecaprenyl-phosphate/decaprenyl-phosphate GlcNAc-1-phosphate transferase
MLQTLLSHYTFLGRPGTPLFAFVVAFGCAAGMVLVTIRICRRYGWTARRREDRWHTGAPCLFGGVPLWLSFVAVAALVIPFRNTIAWRIIAIASLMFVLGLLDDIYHLRPRMKLLAQIAAGIAVASCGVVYPVRPEPTFNFIVSVLWIVGMTNAFNLLDNMDGLSGGVALISAFYLAIFYFHFGLLDYVVLLAAFGGSTAAFLVYNFKPARIFMGDTGSLPMGFLLGSSALLQVTHLSSVSAFVFFPVLVLAIPLFDTFFVSVTRRLRGQPISQGGTDHSSHRLVKLGLDERSAVILLYVLSAVSGAVALLLRRVNAVYALGLIAAWLLFLLLFGIHLFQPMEDYESQSHVPVSLVRRLFSRDMLAVLLDPAALSLAYYLAYLSHFGSGLASEYGTFLKSWPLVVGIKFAVIGVAGMYRRSWWRGSRHDYYRLVQAVLLAEAMSVLMLTGLYHFAGYSRLVFVFDGVLSVVFLTVIRSSFLHFRDLVRALHAPDLAARRVFLVGTSELTESALRYLGQHHIRCVGLIDNNGGGDLGRRVWGTMVLGRIDDIGRLAFRHGVDEVIIADHEPVPVAHSEFIAICSRANVRLTRLGLYDPNTAAEDLRGNCSRFAATPDSGAVPGNPNLPS